MAGEVITPEQFAQQIDGPFRDLAVETVGSDATVILRVFNDLIDSTTIVPSSTDYWSSKGMPDKLNRYNGFKGQSRNLVGGQPMHLRLDVPFLTPWDHGSFGFYRFASELQLVVAQGHNSFNLSMSPELGGNGKRTGASSISIDRREHFASNAVPEDNEDLRNFLAELDGRIKAELSAKQST